MAPLYIPEENDFFCSDDDSSATSSTDASSSASLSSSSSCFEASQPPQHAHRVRSVSFAAGTTVHEGAVMNIEDYSEYEKCECWYQLEEMREIRQDVKDTVAMMNIQSQANLNSTGDRKLMTALVDDVTQTIRGLEGKTRAGKRHRREVRLASIAAVFDEQTLQEMDGVMDPLLIAMAYTEHSYPMQVAALERASIYREEANEIYNEDSSLLLRTPPYSTLKDSNAAEHQKNNVVENSLAQDETSVVCDDVVVGPTICVLEIEEADDVVEQDNETTSSGALDDKNLQGSPAIEDSLSLKDNQKDDILPEKVENFDNVNNEIRPFNKGPLRFRDRFACFLPGATSNRRPALMGALRAVHI